MHSDQRVDYPETLLCVSDYWSFERVKAGGVKETVTVAKADITEKITVQCVTRSAFSETYFINLKFSQCALCVQRWLIYPRVWAASP